MPAKETALITRSSRRNTTLLFEDPPWDCGVASVGTAELLMQGTGKADVASTAGAGGVSLIIPKCRGGRELPLDRATAQCDLALIRTRS